MDRATVSEDASVLLELVGAPDAPTRLRSESGRARFRVEASQLVSSVM